RIRTTVLHATKRSGRARQRHSPRLRRHDEGQGIPGRRGKAQDRGRCTVGRAGGRPGRAALSHAARRGRARAAGDGSKVTFPQVTTLVAAPSPLAGEGCKILSTHSKG